MMKILHSAASVASVALTLALSLNAHAEAPAGVTVYPYEGRVATGPNDYPLGVSDISLTFGKSGLEVNPNAKGFIEIYINGASEPAEQLPASKAHVDAMTLSTAAFTFVGVYNAPGEYRIVVPQGVWSTTGWLSPAMELEYVITSDFTLSPTGGSVVSELSEILLQSEADEVRKVGGNVELMRVGSNEYENLTCRQIADAATGKKNGIQMTCSESHTTAGTYLLTISAGTFEFITYGPNYAADPSDYTSYTNSEMRCNYYVSASDRPTIFPAENDKITDFHTFTLTLGSNFTLSFGDTMATSYIYPLNEMGEAEILPLCRVKCAWGDWDVAAGTITLTVVDESGVKCEAPIVPAKGRYVLRLASGQYYGTSGSQFVSSEPWEYYFTISDKLTDVENVESTLPEEALDIYTLSGVAVALNADRSALLSLPSGVYIVNGKKLHIR